MKTILTIALFLNSCLMLAQINPCASINDYTIVVLGSSTAAGSGASVGDSAWVNRYRNAIKGVNANNQVINLAVGGFTSYRIMPSNFSPPAGRPTPDTAKNITKALSLNPDAIIINLPSNDIANNFTINEQLFNLDSIVQMANAANVPVWVCTTQPKNMSATKMQLQANIKDSIYLHFGNYTIDFWTTLATSSNGLSSIYDSGDGTHLNDAGHGLLFSRVWNKDILTALYQPLNALDFAMADIIEHSPICGDSLAQFEVVLANIGSPAMNNYSIDFNVIHIPTNTSTNQSSVNISNMNTCDLDTFLFSTNTLQSGNYSITASINVTDFDMTNNAKSLTINSLGQPTLTLIGDTTCSSNSAVLEAIYHPNDSLFWYDSPQSSTFIASGSTLSLPNLNATTTYYAEAVRGDFFYRNSLTTTQSSNINWNGAMFDLMPQTDVVIDSFGVKINTLGIQDVKIYYKNGTHIGSEGNAPVWSLLGTATVNVTSITELTNVPLGHLNIPANAIYGIYIQMANPNSRLSYQSVSNPVTRSNSELTIITGSGISHNFSGNFYPRDWNGKVYYHYGFKPKGDCATDLMPVTAHLSNPTIDIGQDTIIDTDSSLTIILHGDFDSYLWFDGSTSPSITIQASDLGKGIHFITLEAMDSLGCVARDTLILGVADLVKTDVKNALSDFKIFPNPFHDYFIVETKEEIDNIQLYNVQGQAIPMNNIIRLQDNQWQVKVFDDLPTGVYFCKIGEFGAVLIKR